MGGVRGGEEKEKDSGRKKKDTAYPMENFKGHPISVLFCLPFL